MIIAVEGSSEPPAPTAPSLSASTLSSSAIRLSWILPGGNLTGYRLERRVLPSGGFTEIARPGAQAVFYDDFGLASSTRYGYRIRAENSSGLSAYSNQEEASTSPGIPAAPTNLRGTATSPSEVTLSWTNNAPQATAVRVEHRPPGTTLFQDVGPAASLTSTTIVGLASRQTHAFRVRAQNSAGLSPYSNVVSVSTPVMTSVVLVHGILQSGGALEPLARALRRELPVDRYRVDASFDWGCCADPLFLVEICDPDCKIGQGAAELRDHIGRTVAPGERLILVGYSMGGLIARHLLLTTDFGSIRPAALATLGTPNFGYPYWEGTDNLLICSKLGGARCRATFGPTAAKEHFPTT